MCRYTKDRSFCLRVLTNQTLYPHETNLYVLAKISINLALIAVHNAITSHLSAPQERLYVERTIHALFSEL
ncbi:invertase/pectin methylesterase inhibitor family protein [Corchorus olitorius]|uniref:Invertase/pectin methylesterase inhibitor family protein n=1 Tax=Corchorus olitorius TaxID=93759 RepID=A0A1R3KPD8_9ROSI|nr:invertase/pectin methylesterase inhibitor family protein [Corchorus olitorius]